MGKRALERSSDDLPPKLEFDYPYGNKKLRFHRVLYLSADYFKLSIEHNVKEMPYVFIDPWEEFLSIQASKQNNRLNLGDYFEASSTEFAVMTAKKSMVSLCRKAKKEYQFFRCFEKYGCSFEDITEYCKRSFKDVNTLIKELKEIYLALNKECYVDVDMLLEQCSKNKKNAKLSFEYLTECLHSLISSRNLKVRLNRAETDPNLKRKWQKMLIPYQSKSEKVNIETIDDTVYPDIKRTKRGECHTVIGNDLYLNNLFVAPYDLKQDANKNSRNMDNESIGQSVDSLNRAKGEAEKSTKKEELFISSKINVSLVDKDVEDSLDKSCILKPDENFLQSLSQEIIPQNKQGDSNLTERAESESSVIQSNDSLKELGVDTGIEENVLSESDVEVYSESNRSRKKDIKTKHIKKNIPLPLNLESKNNPIRTEKQTTDITDIPSSNGKEIINKSGDFSRNAEKIETDTKKREPLTSSNTKSDYSRKRSTSGTKIIESQNANGLISILNSDAKNEPSVRGNISEIIHDTDSTADNDISVQDSRSSLIEIKISDAVIKRRVSIISISDTTEESDVNEKKTKAQVLKEGETENSISPSESDKTVFKVDLLNQTEVRNETVRTENVPLINDEEYRESIAKNVNKNDTERTKDMDNESIGFAVRSKSEKETEQSIDKNQSQKDTEDEIELNVVDKIDTNTSILRDSVEYILEDRKTDTDDKSLKINEITAVINVDEVILSQNEFETVVGSLKENESLVKYHTRKNKRSENNERAEGMKQVEISCSEIQSSSHHDVESKSSQIGEPILEGYISSISNTVSQKIVNVFTNSLKETVERSETFTEKINLPTSCEDGHGKNIKVNGGEMEAEVSYRSKVDRIEPTYKCKETKVVQENVISVENSERTKNAEEKEYIEVKNTNEVSNSLMKSQQVQWEKKPVESVIYSFERILSFQNADVSKDSRGSDGEIKAFASKSESVTDNEDTIMRKQSSKRTETSKSKAVTKRPFDIEFLISQDEPKRRSVRCIGGKQFGGSTLEDMKVNESSIDKSTYLLSETEAEIDVALNEKPLFVDVKSNETKVKQIRNEGYEVVRDLLMQIEESTKVKVNRLRKSNENKVRTLRNEKPPLDRDSRKQEQRFTEDDKTEISEVSRNKVKTTISDRSAAVRDLRKYGGENPKTDENERSTRSKTKVKAKSEVKKFRNQTEGDIKTDENGFMKFNEYKLLNIKIDVCDVVEELRKQTEGGHTKAGENGYEIVNENEIKTAENDQLNLNEDLRKEIEEDSKAHRYRRRTRSKENKGKTTEKDLLIVDKDLREEVEEGTKADKIGLRRISKEKKGRTTKNDEFHVDEDFQKEVEEGTKAVESRSRRRRSKENKEKSTDNEEFVVDKVLGQQVQRGTKVERNKYAKKNEKKLKNRKSDGRDAVEDLVVNEKEVRTSENDEFDIVKVLQEFKEGVTADDELRKSNENKMETRKSDVDKDSQQRVQRGRKASKTKQTKINENKVKTTRKTASSTVRNSRKQVEKVTKVDTKKSLRSSKDIVEESENIETEAISKNDIEENVEKEMPIEYEDKPREDAGEMQLLESSDKEISRIWCFPTKDTAKSSVEGVESERPSSLSLERESMNLLQISDDKDHRLPNPAVCPSFNLNEDIISNSFDTFQEPYFSLLCFKLKASSESRRSSDINQFSSENGDVFLRELLQEDIESILFADNDLSLSKGLNTGQPPDYHIQPASSVMSPRKIS